MYFFILLNFVTNIRNIKNIKCIFVLGTLFYIITVLLYYSKLYCIVIPLDTSYVIYKLLKQQIKEKITSNDNLQYTNIINKNPINPNKTTNTNKYSVINSTIKNNTIQQDKIQFIRIEPVLNESLKYTMNNLLV